MYTIIRKNAFTEEDICADLNSQYDYFENKSIAEFIAKDLTREMAKEAWYGFKWYGDKFFVREVSPEYVAIVCGRNSNIQVAQMMM